jgi:hypothetical protein
MARPYILWSAETTGEALASFISVRGGKSFGSGGFFERVQIEKFDPSDPRHKSLAEASGRAHQAVAGGDDVALASATAAIDKAAGDYWGLSPGELDDMRRLIGYLRSTPLGEVDEGDEAERSRRLV